MGWATIKAFATSPLGRDLGLALAILAVLGGVYLKGRVDGRAGELVAQAAREASARKAVAKTEANAVAITNRTETRAVEKAAEIREVTRFITREVPVYVTVQADAECTVPVGFVRLHDHAAAGDMPGVSDPAGLSHDAPSGLALSAVAGAVTDNYGTCLGEIARLSALQAWVREQAANTGAGP